MWPRVVPCGPMCVPVIGHPPPPPPPPPPLSMSGSNNLHSSPGHHRLGLYSVLSIIQDLQSWPLQVGNPLISWTRLNDVCLFSLDACVRFIWLTRIIPQFPPLDPTFRVFPIADLYADKLRSRSLSSALFAAVISPEPPDQTRPVKEGGGGGGGGG